MNYFKLFLVSLLLFSSVPFTQSMEAPVENSEVNQQTETGISNNREKLAKLLRTVSWYAPPVLSTILANERFLLSGINYWVTLLNVAKMPHSLETLDNANLPPHIKTLIKEVSEKMKVSPQTRVFIQNDDVGSPAFALHKALGVDLETFKYFTPDEQKFAVAHECSHVNHNDTRNRVLIECTAPFISYAILKGSDYCISKILDYISQNYSKNEGDFVNKSVKMAKEIKDRLFLHPFPQYLLNLYLVNKFQQKIELRADREAALALHCATAGVSFFKKFNFMAALSSQFLIDVLQSMNKAYQNMSLLQRWHFYLESWDSRLGLPTHPSFDQRIKALELLQKKMDKK